jgi:glycosyltransferase involved in cell wall biosynthesis
MREEMALGNVTRVGQVPREEAQAYLEASDACVVILRKADLFRTVIPSKIFEAMAAGKPIVLGVDGEARRIVEGAGAGIFVEPENPDALAGAILRLRDDRQLRQQLGMNARRAVERDYTRPVLARRMLEVVAHAATGGV